MEHSKISRTQGTKLQETIEKTSAQLNATTEKIRALTQKTNAELTAARNETKNLRTTIAELNSEQQRAKQLTTTAEYQLKTATSDLELFQARSESFKSQWAESLKVKDLPALEYQLALNAQRETELQTLKKQSAKMAEEIELIPRKIREAKESAFSTGEKWRQAIDGINVILKYSPAPLILLLFIFGCRFMTSKDLSENLAAEAKRSAEMEKQLNIARRDKTATEQIFNNTITTLRQTFPDVEKLYNLPAAEQAKIVQSASKQTAGRQKKRRR